MDEELLQRVAELRGMPASLVERSAAARARKLGVAVEDVLREWAGGAPAASPEPSTPPAPDVPGSPALGVEELLARAAAERGMPASLVERSARARAKKEGVAVETVLAEWAGVEIGAVAPAADAPEAAPAPAAGPRPASEPEVAVEVLPASEPTVAAEAAGAEVPPVEETPRRRSRYPVWLAATFVVVPLIALLYLVSVPNGPRCGSAGRLLVDPATGEAVGCDGNPYGAGQVDDFGAGEALFAANCAICHGPEGGGGVGPAMAGGAVLETFPEGSCALQLRWVTGGSAGWPDPTYGAQGKPVKGGMPTFGASLTDREIAQVVLYERVAFGQEDLETAKADCSSPDAGIDLTAQG